VKGLSSSIFLSFWREKSFSSVAKFFAIHLSFSYIVLQSCHLTFENYVFVINLQSFWPHPWPRPRVDFCTAIFGFFFCTVILGPFVVLPFWAIFSVLFCHPFSIRQTDITFAFALALALCTDIDITQKMILAGKRHASSPAEAEKKKSDSKATPTECPGSYRDAASRGYQPPMEAMNNWDEGDSGEDPWQLSSPSQSRRRRKWSTRQSQGGGDTTAALAR
jgi:hypothetical protein